MPPLFSRKSFESQGSIYGHVGSYIGHLQVCHLHRLDKNPFVISRRFVILAFGHHCNAIPIGPPRRLLIGEPNRLSIKGLSLRKKK